MNPTHLYVVIVTVLWEWGEKGAPGAGTPLILHRFLKYADMQ